VLAISGGRGVNIFDPIFDGQFQVSKMPSEYACFPHFCSLRYRQK
jgi:hypothetical protein